MSMCIAVNTTIIIILNSKIEASWQVIHIAPRYTVFTFFNMSFWHSGSAIYITGLESLHFTDY